MAILEIYFKYVSYVSYGTIPFEQVSDDRFYLTAGCIYLHKVEVASKIMAMQKVEEIYKNKVWTHEVENLTYMIPVSQIVTIKIIE